MKLDILAFGAHPDDVEISVGGTLISEVQQGKKVGLIDLTRGEMGTRGTVEIRNQEAEEARKIIGAVVRENLDMPDAFLEINAVNIEKIIRVIRKYQPDIVITNAPSDRHPDHGHAASLVVEACFKAGLRKYLVDGTGENAWRPKSIYQYMQFFHHQAHFIYDVSHVMDQKLACVLAHKSQFYNPESQEPETIIASPQFKENLRARASEFGIQAGFHYGEPLMVVRLPGVKKLSQKRSSLWNFICHNI
jgi:bacillithiol biosynthesis deacetylase BshB1